MNTSFTFPFGQPVKTLKQDDKESPKSHFVLGVYASAVHARWVDADGKQMVAALAVASEPYIFWKGDGADKVIAKIKIPDGAGTLEAVPRNMNGPSGRSLDECFLIPLGISREDAWLCDIVPRSCRNPKQDTAITEKYVPLMKKYNLPEASLPSVPNPLCDDKRRDEILAELKESGAGTIVLLGDEPVRWLQSVSGCNEKRLADFGSTAEAYGKRHQIKIDGKDYDVLPLVHPRQASKLGLHSPEWNKLHQGWMDNMEIG
jgi:hypothetical protein